MASHGEIKEFTRDYFIATWGEVLIVVWCHDTSMQAVDVAHRCYEEHAGQHRQGVKVLTIVESQASMPESSVRKELSRLLARGAGRTTRSALVHEGTGFRAAAVRSVVTGLSQLMPAPYPHKVFATVADAVLFLEPRSEISAKLMGDAVHALRDRYEANLRKAQ